MVKNYARKNAARSRRAANPGEGHRTAVNATRPEEAVPPVLLCDLPEPDLAGHAPCPACEGRGVTGEYTVHHYDEPTPEHGAVGLLLDIMCPRCHGCGRATHDNCMPIHTTDDPFEVDEYLDGLADEQDEEPCPSCRGRRCNYVQAFREPGPDENAASSELEARMEKAGVDTFQVQGAALFGALDELLGEGAQDLMARADTSMWLRMPCGCAEGLCRPVSLDDMETDHGAPARDAYEESGPGADAFEQFGVLGVTMEISEAQIGMRDALDVHGGDVAATSGDEALRRRWAKAAPETRAGVLLSAAWGSRDKVLTPTDDWPGRFATDFREYARATADSETFHGAAFPAMPLPGQAGALASTLGFDREDTDTALATALRLLAAAGDFA
ncbi:hypothetical protein ACFYZ9_33850 [Streptomyces sp. NPDC001691]|uniref:hypothetical protein n=1 Tax=Streptomyces sp. NPDC001691 TaxID=3364600 RepID=UPI0036CD155E